MSRLFRFRDIGMFAAGAVLALGVTGLSATFAPVEPSGPAAAEPYIPPGDHPGWMRIETRDIADYIPCKDSEPPQVYHLDGIKPYHYQLAVACQHGRLIGLVPSDETEGR